MKNYGGDNGQIPTSNDLKNASYINKGMPWHMMKHIYPVSEDNPYNKEILLGYYRTHNKVVKDYFRHRPKDLLILNASEENAYQKLTDFLGVTTDKSNFP
ncbi:MAG: sulfotransferase [Candidatus Woesearchaeota archaeon]